MKEFLYRFILYGVVMGYLLLDILVFKGPISNWLSTPVGGALEELQEHGIVATVYGLPIYDKQVEYRMEEYLYRRGEKLSSLDEITEKSIYKACLEELILEELLRTKSRYNADQLEGLGASAVVEAKRDKAQFSDDREHLDAVARQGYQEGELELRAEGYLQHLAYLRHRIDVDAHEVMESTGKIPELRKIRHIFYPTLNQDPGEVIRKVQESLGPLRTGWADFETISNRVNGDLRAKKVKGELGWVSAYRLPEGLAEPLFAMKKGEQKILQSKIGWHFIEVLESKSAREVNLSVEKRELKGENVQRKNGLELYLHNLRSRENNKIKYVTPQ